MLSSPSIYGSVWQLLDLICIFCVFIIFVSKEIKPTRFSWTKPTSLVSTRFYRVDFVLVHGGDSVLWSLKSVLSYVFFVVCILLLEPAWGYCRELCAKSSSAATMEFPKKSNFNAVRAVCLLGRVIEFNNKNSSCWKQILHQFPCVICPPILENGWQLIHDNGPEGSRLPIPMNSPPEMYYTYGSAPLPPLPSPPSPPPPRPVYTLRIGRSALVGVCAVVSPVEWYCGYKTGQLDSYLTSRVLVVVVTKWDLRYKQNPLRVCVHNGDNTHNSMHSEILYHLRKIGIYKNFCLQYLLQYSVLGSV